MTLSRARISVQEIRRILTSSGSTDLAIERASRLLSERHDDETVALDEVAAREIATVYRRRLRRIPEGVRSPVLGDHALLAEVERLGDVTLAMGALTINEAVVWVWMDADLDHLVGCIVGSTHASPVVEARPPAGPVAPR